MSPDEKKIATQAADWLVRLQEDRAPENLAHFVDWLEQSPRHMGEFVIAMELTSVVRAAGPARAIDLEGLLRHPPEHSAVVRHPAWTPSGDTAPGDVSQPAGLSSGLCGLIRSLSRRALVMASGAATAVLMLVLAWVWPSISLFDNRTLSTGLGEQRSFQLDDGSLLHLNTQSSVKVLYSRRAREVQLLAGEVFFDVARDRTRPFRVSADASVIQAVGTQFNVYRQPDAVTVAVVEGKVRIEPSRTEPAAAEKLLLQTGEAAAVDRQGHIARHASANIAAAVAWRQRRLVFRSERLDDIAAEFNRYNRLAIKVENETLAAQRASGTFNANEPQAFLQFLQQHLAVEIEHTENSIIVRALADTPVGAAHSR
jgi:transmembrane sensor